MTLSDDQRQTREAQQADDVERLNAAAERLNAEMAEVLEFQSAWPGAEWGIRRAISGHGSR